MNGGIGLISLFSGSTISDRWTGISVVFLLAALFYGTISWKIRRMSIGWTLAGSLMAFVEWITGSTGPGALVVHSIVLIYFVNAREQSTPLSACIRAGLV